MAFSPDVNLGNVLKILGGLGLMAAVLHRFDKRMDSRHQANLAKFNTLTATTGRIERRMDETTARIERKLDENTRQTTEMGKEVAAHIAEDRVFHKQFERDLDEIKQDLKGR